MKNKFLSLLLLGMFSMSVMTAGSVLNPMEVHAALKSESVGADATAEISDDGTTLTITGTGAIDKLLSIDYANCNSSTHSNAVTTITDSDLVAIETIIIGEGITSIPDYCFATNEVNGYRSCYNAETLQLPSTLESIGKEAFINNGDSKNNIKDLVIPDSVTSVGTNAFRGALNGSLTIGSGLTTLTGSSFTNLLCTEVNIPDTVTAIDAGAITFSFLAPEDFSTTINIGSGVSIIADDAFKFTPVDSYSALDAVPLTLNTTNEVALAYNWEGNGFTFGSDGNTAEFTVTGTISAITTVDVTVPIGGVNFGVGEDGNISSQGIMISSNTPAPLSINVLEVSGLDANDDTNGLVATTAAAPTLVPVATYTADEWNNLTKSETLSKIALSLKQVDVIDGEVGVALTDATTDTLKVTTPVELGNLTGTDKLAHLQSGFGEASVCGINLETDVAYTNYGKNWANADDVVFRYLVTLEFALDQ